jgi:hypothetical protein
MSRVVEGDCVGSSFLTVGLDGGGIAMAEGLGGALGRRSRSEGPRGMARSSSSKAAAMVEK